LVNTAPNAGYGHRKAGIKQGTPIPSGDHWWMKNEARPLVWVSGLVFPSALLTLFVGISIRKKQSFIPWFSSRADRRNWLTEVYLEMVVKTEVMHQPK